MRRVGDGIVLAAGDLVTFLGCRHACALDRRSLNEFLERAPDDPTLEILATRGLAHERAYRDSLAGRGLSVVDIPNSPGMSLAERASLTLDALQSGADVVFQGVLLHGVWHGIADFLVRVDTPSDLGAWSYEPIDSKLASGLSPTHAIQLSVYVTLLAALQGVQPRHVGVVLGRNDTVVIRTDDYASYVRLASRRLEAFLADGAWTETVPEPCGACERCQWRDRCKAEWEADDHLSLVANIRRSQISKLRAAGIDTVAALAAMPAGHRVRGMAPETLLKLHRQAGLQVAVRGTDETRFEYLEPGAGRGFDRLPLPSAGDLWIFYSPNECKECACGPVHPHSATVH